MFGPIIRRRKIAALKRQLKETQEKYDAVMAFACALVSKLENSSELQEGVRKGLEDVLYATQNALIEFTVEKDLIEFELSEI